MPVGFALGLYLSQRVGHNASAVLGAFFYEPFVISRLHLKNLKAKNVGPSYTDIYQIGRVFGAGLMACFKLLPNARTQDRRDK